MFKVFLMIFGILMSTSSLAHGPTNGYVQCDQRWIFVPGHYDSFGYWIPTRRFYGTQCWDSNGMITTQHPHPPRPTVHHHHPRPNVNIRINIPIPRPGHTHRPPHRHR